jgi:flagellum-specific peptidoglycan hydrolase FlgJ
LRNELPNKLTPVSTQELLYGLANAWFQLVGEVPSKQSLLVLISQITLESGAALKSCHCFNLGNIKSTTKDNIDYTYYKCNEVINGKIIWFDKPSPAARFVAFNTLEEGCLFYLNFLKTRYGKKAGVWDAVLAGDPALFVQKLKQNNYFTASLLSYSTAVLRLFNQFQSLNYDPSLVCQIDEQTRINILNNLMVDYLQNYEE